MKKKENVLTQIQEENISDEDLKLENSAEGDRQEPENDSGGEDQEPDETLKVLRALYPILHLSHQYKVGEALPANDPGMVQAWLDAGTAAWIRPAGGSPKAKPRTAEPGLPGRAVSSEAEDGDDLAGKVPRTFGRKRQT